MKEYDQDSQAAIGFLVLAFLSQLRSFLNFSGADTTGADVHFPGAAVLGNLDGLDIGVGNLFRPVVGVADVIADEPPLSAYFTFS